MKLRQILLISILLLNLYLGSAAAAIEIAGNATGVVVGPAGEEIDADPGIMLLEMGAATTGDGETQETKESGETGFGDGIKGARPPVETASYKVEVRGWNPEKKKTASAAQYKQTDLDFILSRASKNVGELEEYTEALAQSDANIENIVVTESSVSLSYKYPAKLLWIVDVNYIMTATVDEAGRVTVKLPWWLPFSKNNAGDITGALENALANFPDTGQLATLDMQNAMQKQQQTLQTMSNISKARHDIAMASIRNTRA